MASAASGFADLLVESIDRAGSPACVGIDPVIERIPDRVAGGSPVERIRSFSLGVVDAVAGVVPAVKPQSAMFERYGSAGFRVLEEVCTKAREAGLVVVLDAKRGDIGNTSAHYAACAAGMGAHCVTVNAYLGLSGIVPFLEAGLGVYALVRTSNPDSDEVQGVGLASGGTVGEHVGGLIARLGAEHVGTHGVSAVGAVVGATKAGADGARLRGVMPDTPFLVPGVGAQGGTAADVVPLTRGRAVGVGTRGVLVSASRSVLYPAQKEGGSWEGTIRLAAVAFAEELRGAFA